MLIQPVAYTPIAPNMFERNVKFLPLYLAIFILLFALSCGTPINRGESENILIELPVDSRADLRGAMIAGLLEYCDIEACESIFGRSHFYDMAFEAANHLRDQPELYWTFHASLGTVLADKRVKDAEAPREYADSVNVTYGNVDSGKYRPVILEEWFEHFRLTADIMRSIEYDSDIDYASVRYLAWTRYSQPAEVTDQATVEDCYVFFEHLASDKYEFTDYLAYLDREAQELPGRLIIKANTSK